MLLSAYVVEKTQDNPYFTFGKLSAEEAVTCRILARAGQIGWREKALEHHGLSIEIVEGLMDQGHIIKAKMIDLLRVFVEDPHNRSEWEEMQRSGGFLSLREADERNFCRRYDRALEALKDPDNPKYQHLRYKLSDQLLGYVGLLR